MEVTHVANLICIDDEDPIIILMTLEENKELRKAKTGSWSVIDLKEDTINSLESSREEALSVTKTEFAQMLLEYDRIEMTKDEDFKHYLMSTERWISNNLQLF